MDPMTNLTGDVRDAVAEWQILTPDNATGATMLRPATHAARLIVAADRRYITIQLRVTVRHKRLLAGKACRRWRPCAVGRAEVFWV